ncbi:hypothetical protein A4X09_0g7421 [Tilletia walkeri]|uniref:Uncharacterized protein n=1 Tax=Tilletia walkeri TaxID=117179 RepID=A0A8X7T1N6_9BASI|nr:hypothetical protein A4X09_0g7421 [Tilletia walkeri]
MWRLLETGEWRQLYWRLAETAVRVDLDTRNSQRIIVAKCFQRIDHHYIHLQMHWSLGIDEGKKKLNLYELFTKLTQSYQVPLTKERILRVAYLRSIAAKSNPRVFNGGPKSDWWSTVDASVEKMLKQFTGNQPGCSK